MMTMIEMTVREKRKRSAAVITAVIIAAVYIIAVRATDFSLLKALKSFPESFVWISKNFYPDESSMKKLPNIMQKLKDTILMSISATMFASVFAFLMALMGSGTTKANTVLQVFSRGLASVFRNIPEVVWSMIFLFTFSQTLITGFLALFFVTLGVLARAFSETIDEAAVRPMEGLKATGAGYWEVIFQGIIPSSMPQFMSWILYMIETNIRSATLIGILTGTGIGHLFNLYYKSLNYHACSLVVIATVISVLAIEGITNIIRRVII